MRVIGFDAWTVGVHHYQRLVEAFTRKDLELILIHLGSWGHEKGRLTEELIGNLRVRDISFYGGKSFREILQLENPAAVIFLSTDAFAHRAFNRYCRLCNVPAIHLFHGLQQLMDISYEVKKYKRIWQQKRLVLDSFRNFWPAYARSLWETEASPREWFRFAQDIFGRARGYRPKTAAKDSRTDKACVYIDSEIRCATDGYGYLEEDVFAVGNPDLIAFGMSLDMIGSRIQHMSTKPQVMYIDTALIDYGFVFDSKDDFVRHVIQTQSELSRQEKHLIFKPHPAQYPEVVSAIANAGVEICSKENFLASLQACCACITEPSTASLMPGLMGMPLFLAQYGNLRGQSFGKLINSYPRAQPLVDLRDFNSLLAKEQAKLEAERTMRWIGQHTGPLPAESMPDRVANVVLALVHERQGAARAVL